MKKRIVITGMGLISPVGNTVEENWNGILAGKSGIGPITHFELPEGFPVTFAGEVKNFDPEKYNIDKKEARRYDGFILYAMAAAEMAMANSGLKEFNNERAGVLIGSGIGGFQTICDTQTDYIKSGHRKVSPFFIPGSIINMAAGLVSIRHKLLGPNIGIVTACTTGTHALGEAAKCIERGDADIMLAGGTEAPIVPIAAAGFANMKALSRRNDAPEKASRPFDKDRDGFVMAEGAGMLVLESLEHAQARGATIYAEVAGYGASSDAYHITAPDETGQGARRAMSEALRDGGIKPEEVGYINAHGTSTEYNDMLETKAIKELFGAHAYKLFVSSTKSMTGHMLGAAGATEAIFCVLALQNGIIPPTINLDNPDERCDLNYVPHKPINAEIKYALSNSFGFGGTNGSILLKKY
ncbi:MAG: beta-ketoacyl-ACP synthase II [Deferribacteraceae bacterium]|jgi:3-oxoacyl-[acyl-carrier-protein] synthase II|nr:beta-ketoacyl-ACP synthase II [Deferribacteraceae bacterium]